MTYRVGVDTGGTFTDLVCGDAAGRFRMAKTLSIRGEASQATENACRKAGLAQGDITTLVHGTTIATNALVERQGPLVGLLTTAGFRDVLHIQRGNRPNPYNLEWVRSRPIVPRYLTCEARERIGPDGAVRVALDEDDVRAAARYLREQGVEVVAVSFLFSFLNGSHERRAREILLRENPAFVVSISSEVFGQWREYERTSTCVIDAFLKPTIDQYARELEGLAERQAMGELLMMRSNGGAMTPDGARALPVSVVRSGPAGGVIASVFIGELTGISHLIMGDMGGTSFDTCLIRDGQPALTTQSQVEFGIPISVPMVDVRSIGAGGGSIAWVDAAGLLRVGPHSAGASPGPACYGRGGREATVTDANLVLGRLGSDLPLAGDVQLDLAAAEAAVGRLAGTMGRSVDEVALGIVHIADNNMAQALRLVSVDRGADPRDYTLIAFGGAGPLHASALARALSIRRIIVPVFPGAFSALGALIADTRFDYMKTWVTRSTDDVARVGAIFDELEAQAQHDLRREKIDQTPTLIRAIEMRYAGQNWELEVILDGAPTAEGMAALRSNFHRVHARRFGWSLPDGELEFVTFKLTAHVPRAKPTLPEIEAGPPPRPFSEWRVLFEGQRERQAVPVYWRDDLHRDTTLSGPAIIAESDATVLLPPGDTLAVDRFGNLLIETV